MADRVSCPVTPMRDNPSQKRPQNMIQEQVHSNLTNIY